MISLVLGSFFGITIVEILRDIFSQKLSYKYTKMGFFISSCGFYHFMEFMYKLEYHLKKGLTWHDFQIDHSKAYAGAMFLCMLETRVRQRIIGHFARQIMDIKNQGFIAQTANAIEYSTLSKIFTGVGVCMVLVGHLFRVWSMFHAGKSFNHFVQTKKAQDHELVTSGPYRWSRHPSYFGWTTWAVGTQLVLSNPVCAILW